MAGVSSQSLAAAQSDLEAKLPTAGLPLAKELFGVLDVFDSSAGLRRALTDPARSTEEKTALTSRLLRGKVSPETESIVAGLAGSRWGSARDIGDALETLAATVAISVAERHAEGAAGLEALEEDLFAFIRVVGSSHDLQRALDDPQAPADAKRELALKVSPGAGEIARVLIAQAVESPRGLKPAALVQKFVELVAKRQQRWIAQVSATRPLTDEQFNRLQAGLNKLYGRDLKISVAVDPSLVGGLRVVVGDEVVDATAATRLAELRRRLAG